MQPPQDMQAEGTLLGSRGKDGAWPQTPPAMVQGTSPRGRHPATPTASNARAHAVGPVLGPHTRTDRTRDTRVAEPWLPAPEDGQSGEGQRLTSDAPHHGGRHPPSRTLFRHPHGEQRRPARAHAVGPVLGPHARTDRARDTWVTEPWQPAPEDGRPGEGQRLTLDAPRNAGKRPPRGRPSATPTTRKATTHKRTTHGTSAPHPLPLGTATQQWRNPRPHAKHAPDLLHWTKHTTSSGRWDSETAKETPPKGDAGTDFDLEAVPEPPTGGAPAEPAPPAGSVPALCPAWKRGHCTGEGWCPKQHPQPGPNDGALPEVKPAAACAAPRYGVAQGLILDETARGSMNIQEAVDRVTHAGQAAVALHTQGRHGGPAEGIIVEPSGMVLVLAADMVRGVLHASRVRRACPQWTIQVYTPPRAWPFSSWAVLAVMWHLAPEDAPIGTAEDIARDLHTWPADQDYPWRRPRGGLPVAPAAEGLSLAATLQRHPDKKACHFLQTGKVPATPPDSEWRWDAGVAQVLPGPWTLPLWYLPMGTLAHATQAVKGAFPQPLLPGVALLRSLQAGPPGYGGRKERGARAPISPWSRARR